MRTLRVAFASVALAIGGSAADAQPTVAPTIYCTGGVNCFALAWSFSGSSATLWLQNLQGSHSAGAALYEIQSVDIARRFWNPLSDGGELRVTLPDLTIEGAVEIGRTGIGDHYHWSDGVDDYRFFFHDGVGVPSYGLVGCETIPPDEFGPRYHSTCPARGLDGWLRFDFSRMEVFDVGTRTLRPMTFDDVAIGIGGCEWIGAASGLTAQDVEGGACDAFPYDTFTPVQEPASIALVASGLLAIGGVGTARRIRARAARRGAP